MACHLPDTLPSSILVLKKSSESSLAGLLKPFFRRLNPIFF
ncbi:hypothetical protein MCC93_15300 [Morococcus cerebrosus]|uniref:Uncharacterized protein n=1 Tax=Morococcus cerebrosus TaxID=1056807 RepID=A0A0C1EEC2_9NEIS|nr:hypothetical protein MCC93_15300 [Morococcus cerebrosus]